MRSIGSFVGVRVREPPRESAVGQKTFQLLENFWRKVIDLSDHVLNDLNVKHLHYPACPAKFRDEA